MRALADHPLAVADVDPSSALSFVLDDEERVCLHDPARGLFLLRLNQDGWGWVHQLAGEESGGLVIGEAAFLDRFYPQLAITLPAVVPLGPRSLPSPLAAAQASSAPMAGASVR